MSGFSGKGPTSKAGRTIKTANATEKNRSSHVWQQAVSAGNDGRLLTGAPCVGPGFALDCVTVVPLARAADVSLSLLETRVRGW
jgi:hypothetical protein